MSGKSTPNRTNPSRRKASLGRVSLFAATVSLSSAIAIPRSTHIDLFPKLQAGQTLTYAITCHLDKQTKTKSSIVLAQSPASTVISIRALLQIEIVSVASQGSRAVIHARAAFQPSEAEASPANKGQDREPESQTPTPLHPAEGPLIEFTILADGRLDQIAGVDALSPDQQQAWQQWAARFAASALFPADGIKPAQKWKTEEPERSPSPIAGLTWIRESTYVRNEPCRPLHFTPQGDLVESDKPADTCAVILTTASLQQQSSAKDATPEDYRVRELHTSGSASGNNKTILYLSLRDGLVVRATDEADQSMSVTIAKADASNQVHYDIQAKSAAEIVLVNGIPPKRSP